MEKRYMKGIISIPLVAAVMAAAGISVNSCSETIDIPGNVDPSSLENSLAVKGFLKVPDNPRMKVVELRTEPVTIHLQAALSNTCSSIAEFTFNTSMYGSLATAYNQEHGTSFEALPESCLTLEDRGVAAVAPGDRESYIVDLKIVPDGLETGKTYILPVTLVCSTPEVTVSEEDKVTYFLIKALGERPSAAKASGIVSIVYVEVNGYNPLNAGEWTLTTSGKPLFDIVNIFAANIKFDESTGRPYLSFNPNVKAILSGRDKYIKPLQDKGMKVSLSVLPDHDGVGFANLTDADIRTFAAELKSVVETYGLDGVDFDDEYGEYSSHNRPGFEDPGSLPYAKLCYEVKRIMPDKLCTVYFIGSATEGFETDIEGMEPGDFIDYSYFSSYGSWSEAYMTIKGMERNQWGPYPWDMTDFASAGSIMTSQVRSGGYGVQVFYDLRTSDDPNVPSGRYESTFNLMCPILYDEGATHSGIDHEKDW